MADQPPAPKPTWQESLTQITNLLTPAKETLVIIRPNPDADNLAGGLALNMALKKIGRKSNLVCPAPNVAGGEVGPAPITPESVSQIQFDPNQVLNFLPKNQLTFTIDYKNGSFSQGKMNPSTEGFGLTLLPEPSQPPIEPLRIDSAIYISAPQAVFTVGIENLSHLGSFYQENMDFFNKTNIINVDYHSNNANYGKANLIDPKSTSVCEMVTLMLYDLKFVLDEEIAQMLYSGLKTKTGNFAENYFSANMLEATSICLRYMKKE